MRSVRETVQLSGTLLPGGGGGGGGTVPPIYWHCSIVFFSQSSFITTLLRLVTDILDSKAMHFHYVVGTGQTLSI